MNVPDELMQDKNYGEDKLYLLEQVDWRNNYEGNNMLGAGYAGVKSSFRKVEHIRRRPFRTQPNGINQQYTKERKESDQCLLHLR